MPLPNARLTVLRAAAAVALLAPPTHGALAPRYDTMAKRANTHVQSGDHGVAVAVVDSMLADARSVPDSLSIADLLRMKGEILARFGRSREAVPALREAIRAAGAVSDTATMLRSLFWLGNGLRGSEAMRVNDEMLRMALARHDTLYEARARVHHAFRSLNDNRFGDAQRQYAHVIELFEAVNEPHSLGNALIGLGRAHAGLGEYDASRQTLKRAGDLARQHENSWLAAHVNNNLGAIEFTVGDPSEAIPHYRRAVELHRRTNNHGGALTALGNIAVAHKHLGQFDEAANVLDESLEIAKREGLADQITGLEVSRAGLEQLRGQPAAALERFRQIDVHRSNPDTRMHHVLGMATCLHERDSTVAAIALLEAEAPGLRPQLPTDRRILLDLEMANLLVSAGRFEDALLMARRADRDAERHGVLLRRLRTLPLIAGCQEALGRDAGALATLRLAATVWESERSIPKDPEWRAERGASSTRIYTQLAGALLDEPGVEPAARARNAYDAVQPFKARTLRERVMVPGGATGGQDASISLDVLQRSVLSEGELLLDAFLGLDKSILFAVTRDTCVAIRLPANAAIAERLTILAELLSSPPDPGDDRVASLEEIARAVSGWLLGDIRTLIAGSTRVIVSPDGALHVVPPGILLAFMNEDFMGRRDVEVVPSASMLAAFRRDQAMDDAPGRLLVLAGRRDAEGRPLEGVEEEARWLQRAFDGVELRMGKALDAQDAGRGLSGFDVLHLAAHTSVNAQSPWRSGVRFESADGQPAVLRADAIAGLRLGGRLTVLSGCESAGGRNLFGEGIQGLTNAFLQTGTSAVVATLWPVDDRATARFMRHFYEELEAGHPVATALRLAQHALMSAGETADPFYWAAFVVIGNGGEHVQLEYRRNPMPMLAAAGVVAVAGAAGLAIRRRKRRHVLNSA